MKKLSVIFLLLAIFLSNAMCIVVTYNCTVLLCVPGNSAPMWVGLLFGIPFLIAIIACIAVSYAAYKKSKVRQ